MDDSTLMRRFHSFAYLIEPVGANGWRKFSAALQFGAQSRSKQVFHHQISAARTDRSIIVDRDDVGMTQLSAEPRFTLETGQSRRISKQRFHRDLDRNPAVQSQIRCL